jgi:hypothetical protein
MKVTITHIYGSSKKVYLGTSDEVREQVKADFPFLGRYPHESLKDDLHRLSITQSLLVDVDPSQ